MVLAAVGLLLTLAAILFGVLWYRADADNGSLNDKLSQSEDQLQKLGADLDSTKSQLTSVQSQLDDSKTKLGTTETQLASTQQEATNTRDELGRTQGQLSAAQAQLAAVQADVDAARRELSTAQANLAATKADAERCSTGGQAFIDALNTLVEVDRRYEVGGATLTELKDAADAAETAYNTFVANCNLHQ